MAHREKDSADFDLEAFVELFDEALTSDDPSVQKTLQHLMTICALARNHDGHGERRGPLRRLYEDMNNINRRLERLELGNTTLGGGYRGTPFPGTTTTPLPAGPYTWPPGTIWGATSGTGMKLADTLSVSAVSDVIAERAEHLLSSHSYKGSSVGTDAVVRETIK